MTDDAVGPDVAVVAADDAGDGGEADAGAFEVFIAVEAIEGVEELIGVEHVETSAVIADEPGAVAAGGGVPADIDDGALDAGAELDGVAEEVFKGDTEEFGIAVDRQAGLDVEGELALGVRLLEVGCDGFGDLGEVEGFAGELLAGDAGELQEGVDELAHALDAGADAADVVAADGVDGFGVVLFQGEGEAVDGAEGGAEVVGDGVAEGFELAVGGFELGGAEADALFEGGVEEVNLGGDGFGASGVGAGFDGVRFGLGAGGGETFGGELGVDAHGAFALEIAEHEDDEEEIHRAGEADGEAGTQAGLFGGGFAEDKQSLLGGLHAVGDGAEVIHLGFAGAAEGERLEIGVDIAAAALADSLLEEVEALIEDGAHLAGVGLLDGVVGGELFEAVDFGGEIGDGLGVGGKVGVFAGDEEAAVAGLGVFGGAHDALDLTDDFEGVLDPELALEEDVDGAEGQPCVHDDHGDGPKE